MYKVNTNSPMNRTALILLLLFVSNFTIFAQAGTEPSCYEQYLKLFEQRGANDVEDGMYDNIIISVRQGSKTDCYRGKVTVEKKNISSIYFKFTDGTFELFSPILKFKQEIPITNGISKTMLTVDDKLINIIFINHLKPKKKTYEKAPLPSIDDL